MNRSDVERRPLLSSSFDRDRDRSLSTIREDGEEPPISGLLVTPSGALFTPSYSSQEKFSPTQNPSLVHVRDSVLEETSWSRFLSSPGITLSFQDVSIIQKRFWSPTEQKLVVQACNGFFEPGKIHAVVDVERIPAAGMALMDVLSGSKPPATGTVTGNNVPVASTRFRPAVGMIATEPSTVLFGNLSVFENVAFALEMRCQCPAYVLTREEEVMTRSRMMLYKKQNASSCGSCCSLLRYGKEESFSRVSAAVSFFNLDPSVRAKSLTLVQQFLLVLAMELVLDPPIIFVATPHFLHSLDPHSVTEILTYLEFASTTLGKTIVLLLQSLPFPVFDRLQTVVLLGMEGQTLYSGDKTDMLTYFSTLGLPTDTLSSPMYDTFSPAHVRPTSSIISSNNLNNANSSFSIHSAASLAIVAAQQDQAERRRAGSAPVASSPTDIDRESHRHRVLQSFNPHNIDEDTRDAEEETLIFDTGDAVVDLAVLWAESLDTTVRFAATYYDSAVRRQLTQRQEEQALANTFSGTMTMSSVSPTNISFLKFRPQSWWNQIGSLCHVFFLQSIRESDFYILWAILTLVLGFTSWLVSSQTDDSLGMMNTRGLIFLLLFVTLQVNVGHVHTYCSEIELYRYQRDSGFYSWPVYLVVFFARLAASRIVYLATLVPFVLYLLDTSRTLITLLGMLSVCHATIVYLTVLVCLQPRVVQILSLFYVGYCVVFSGFLVNLTSLPEFAGALSLLRAGYAAAVAEELHGKAFNATLCDAGNSTLWDNTTSSYCYYGDQYLALEGFTNDTPNHSTNVFIGVTFIVLLCIALRLRYIS